MINFVGSKTYDEMQYIDDWEKNNSLMGRIWYILTWFSKE